MASQGNYIALRPFSNAKSSPAERTTLVADPEDFHTDLQDDAVNSKHGANVVQTIKSALRIGSDGRSWRILLTSGALTGVIVFFINLATLIVAYARFNVQDHVATVWTGDCDRASGIVTAAHLVINVLGTLLLAASNASMQILGSPTREEVDLAHRKGKGCAIGIPSLRNVFRVSWPKMLVWWLLAASSLPLHLFWNSTVFNTLATNNYYAMSIAEDFTRGAAWTVFQNGTTSSQIDGLWGAIADMQTRAGNSSLQRLERTDCIREYGRELVINRRNVLMVTNSKDVQWEPGANSSSLLAVYSSAFTPNASKASTQDNLSYGWMCAEKDGSYCSLSDISRLEKDDSLPWIPGYYEQNLGEPDHDCGDFGNGLVACGFQNHTEVQYCLSEAVDGQCKVSLVPEFLIVVCVCNIAKIVAFILTIHLTWEKGTLVTQGDAIRSFLDTPDVSPSTQGLCLATRDRFMTIRDTKPAVWQVDRGTNGQLWPDPTTAAADPTNAYGQQTKYRARLPWAEAANGAFWMFTYVLVVAFLIVSAKLFIVTNVTVAGQEVGHGQSWSIIFSQGLGQPLPSFNMGTGNIPILKAFIAANLPQLGLSYIYILINILLTTMLGMAEWTSYYAASVAKGLRVSAPVEGSKQTSSYSLTVPLQWGAPSLILFMILHWLTSQMIFAARTEAYSPNGQLNSDDTVTQVYFSPIIAICLVGILCLAMVAFLGIAIIKRFPADAPLGGNWSLSIAAACQPLPSENMFEPDLSRKALRWGVVKVPYSDKDVGHATFSDGNVGRLVAGMAYA